MAVKLPPYLFWLDWVGKIIWEPFWWLILFLIILWVPFLRVWWWIFLPIMLASQLKKLYLWWLDWDYSYAKWKWLVLEVVPPKEVLVPYKAMEDVFAVIWPIYDGANWWDKWCDGEMDNAPFWMSWEIASVEGKIHFYLRLLSQHRMMVETALYSHYPDIEIREVADYTKSVPANVPNEEWDTYGEDFVQIQPAPLPIKTYDKFFEPQGERISAEEKRIDPLLSLLESMAKIGPGEQYWVQFITIPVTEKDQPSWKKEAAGLITKYSKRPEKKEKTLWQEITDTFAVLVYGPKKEGSGDKAKYSWLDQQKTETMEKELLITPGEREVLAEIENKIKKPIFRTVIRAVYVAKRENWKAPHRVMMRAYTAHFTTANLNRIQFNSKTRPKVTYFMRKRRAFLRARRMFRNYVHRFTPAFPNRMDMCPILNTEEMATLYHFPLRTTGMAGPSVIRVESKKSGPPPNLPVE